MLSSSGAIIQTVVSPANMRTLQEKMQFGRSLTQSKYRRGHPIVEACDM